MKPLRFKVKKLYDLDKFGQVPGEYVPLAYQLTPEEPYADYPGIDSECRYKYLFQYLGCWQNRMEIYIPARDYEYFKRDVHEYNLKYCEVPDVKVLDGFMKKLNGTWGEKNILTYDEYRQIFVEDGQSKLEEVLQRYQATLVSPESWFEMESE